MANIKIQKIILGIIRGGLEPWANPNYPGTGIFQVMIDAIDEIEYGQHKKEKHPPWQKYNISRTYKKLIADKLIKINRDGLPRLTKEGEKHLAGYDLEDHKIISQGKWDGKYRVIIFDIKEKKRRLRTIFRRQLKNWGFALLQNSVWVYPYECQEAVSLLKSAFGLATDVVYMVVDSIENDEWIKKEFKLK